MKDILYFNDNDLKKYVQEFAEEYFYDFPLIIHDVYFGRKVLSTLGYCIPLNKSYSDYLVNQNLDEVENKSKITESDIEINGYFKELNVTETLLHEMCHSVNFSMGDNDANHGKLWKDVAKVISQRSGYDLATSGTDEYLNFVLSQIQTIKKLKKEPNYIVSYRKIIKNYQKYEDLFVKTIDELNDICNGVGDIMQDLILNNSDLNDKEILNQYADLVDKLISKKQIRWWNF